MPKAKVSKFLYKRINKDWIDKLFPQGWEIEDTPHPTRYNININTLDYFSIAQ